MYVYVFVVVCGAAAIVSVILVFRACVRLLIRVVEGTNDDAQAIEWFLDLVRTMKQEIIIHDDGDRGPTLYRDPRVIAALVERLKGGAQVRVLFNMDEPNGLTDLVNKYGDRLQVYILPEDADWRSEEHFKIIDRGRKAYLSRHLDNGTRKYRMVDCTKVPRTGRKLFADRIEHFEAGVGIARPAATSDAAAVTC